MRHLFFTPQAEESYKVAVLIKASSFNKQELTNNYLKPLIELGLSEEQVIAFTLQYGSAGKVTAKEIKEYLNQLLPVLEDLKVQCLYVADANYFKVLSGQTKAEPHHGYVLPCKIKGYEHMNVVLGINYAQLIYNPNLKQKMLLGLTALANYTKGNYTALGQGIIHGAKYPKTVQEIAEALEELHQYPSLTCDIEGFSLRFNEAGIGTIAFAWDEHNGIAFAVDYKSIWSKSGHPDPLCDIDIAGYEGFRINNTQVKALLLEFFTTYQGNLTFHNSPYDIESIIFSLWMKHPRDTEGLLTGLDIMTRDMDDTKVITYLATNSTAGNVLGLKPLAHEFAGNWAVEEIQDIRKIPLDKLLQYNLVDALSTWYVKKKYQPSMVADQQEDLYKSLMMPSQKLIIQLEMTGMPMNRTKIQEAKDKLLAIQQKHLDVFTNNPIIKTLELLMTEDEWLEDYESRKAKAKNPHKIQPKDKATFPQKVFNPNSGPQLQKLLYKQMGLPVIDKTETKQPATGADTLEKLKNHTTIQEYKDILDALIGYGKVTKILSSFIPTFEAGINMGNGVVWLHGSFNLGGTVSGRLSSSDPNLQNLPAGSTFGKLIKDCFRAPKDWLFGGADFNSLEDYISALTTKDPNKLDVYIKGFDGHCLRAAYYFRDQLPHIDLTDPQSVNSIKKSHPELRQESKAPTFALTYQGTWITLVNNLGWTEEVAKKIEANYHELYKVSDQYVQARLKQASIDGFVEVAFGLRVRTPLLKQVVFGSSKMPFEAAAEGRTAGNALGQSYGLLNNRAAVEFFQKVWASPYRHQILPVALIHDSIYILIRDDIETVEWANRELIASMKWQELPEIQHPTVKLGANLDLFWPSWAHAITLPNNASQKEIRDLATKAMNDTKKTLQQVQSGKAS